MGEEGVKQEAMQIIGLFQVLPRLVVFDLDYTLWPFYCECCSNHEMPSMYPHAKGILYALKDKGVDVAVASRSPTPDIANTFLDKLGIKSLFVAQEIFSSWTHKTEHFQKIHRKTGVPFNSMLFFDDEGRNTDAVSKMGVTSVLVGNGVNLGALRQGLTLYSQNLERIEKNKQQWSKFTKKSSSSQKDGQVEVEHIRASSSIANMMKLVEGHFMLEMLLPDFSSFINSNSHHPEILSLPKPVLPGTPSFCLPEVPTQN